MLSEAYELIAENMITEGILPLSAESLNCKIMEMRKYVKKAVVSVIHHLTTRIKKLRNKKGTDDQKQQNNLKADKLAAEIMILKRIKPDDISEFGLLNYKESELKQYIWKNVIAPETRAKAKVCLEKKLRLIFDDFVRAHSDEVDVLMQLLEERFANRNKKKKNKKGKKMSKTNKNSSCVSDSDESVPELVDPASDNLMNSDLDRMDGSDNELYQGTENVANKPNEKIHLKHDTKAVKMNNNSSSLNSGSKSIWTEKKSKSKNESSYTVEKQNIESKKIQIDSGINQKQISERKNVDPFFITKDNSNYHTYCNVEANSKNDVDEKPKDKEFHKNSPLGFRKGFISQKNNTFRKNSSYQPFDRKKNHSDGKVKRFTGKEPKTSVFSSCSNTSEVKLHPSWEAKKKMSISSVPFQGQKIKFDD